MKPFEKYCLHWKALGSCLKGSIQSIELKGIYQIASYLSQGEALWLQMNRNALEGIHSIGVK